MAQGLHRAKRRWTERELAEATARLDRTFDQARGNRHRASTTPIQRAAAAAILPRNFSRFEAFTFELPWAPSVNNNHANTSTGRVKTKRATAFVAAAARELMAQRVPTNYIAHPCEITIYQFAPTGEGDVDNGFKIVLDALKKYGVIADDNRKIVKRVSGEDGESVPGGRLIVRIAPFDEKPLSLAHLRALTADSEGKGGSRPSETPENHS